MSLPLEGIHRRRHRAGRCRPAGHPQSRRPRRAGDQGRTHRRRRLRPRLRPRGPRHRGALRLAQPGQGVDRRRPQVRGGLRGRAPPGRPCRRLRAEPRTRGSGAAGSRGRRTAVAATPNSSWSNLSGYGVGGPMEQRKAYDMLDPGRGRPHLDHRYARDRRSRPASRPPTSRPACTARRRCWPRCCAGGAPARARRSTCRCSTRRSSGWATRSTRRCTPAASRRGWD